MVTPFPGASCACAPASPKQKLRAATPASIRILDLMVISSNMLRFLPSLAPRRARGALVDRNPGFLGSPEPGGQGLSPLRLLHVEIEDDRNEKHQPLHGAHPRPG